MRCTLGYAILTSGAERNFPIKSGLANMRDYFFAARKKQKKQNNVCGFRDKMASNDLFSDSPLTCVYSEAGTFTGRPGLPERPLIERQGRSEEGQAS